MFGTNLSRYTQLTPSDEVRVARLIEIGTIMSIEVNQRELRLFCSEFSELLGYHGMATLFSSGTAAAQAGLIALECAAGDAVALPAVAMPSTLKAVLALGAHPVFIDVDPNTGLIDSEELSHATARHRLRLVIVAHLHGSPAPIGELAGVADRRETPILEDVSEGFGATVNGRPVGTASRAAFFSLRAASNLAAGGEAGVLLTRDSADADRADRLNIFGAADLHTMWQRDHSERVPGSPLLQYNFRPSPLVIAVARGQLARFPAVSAERQNGTDRLLRVFQEAGFVPVPLPERVPAWERIPLTFPESNRPARELVSALRMVGIPAVSGSWFLPEHPLLSRESEIDGGFPGARRFLERTVLVDVLPQLRLAPDDHLEMSKRLAAVRANILADAPIDVDLTASLDPYEVA